MDDAPERLRRLPTWLLSRAHTRARRVLTDALAAEGVRGYDVRVLAALAEAGPCSQADLGRLALLDRSDVTAAVEDLERRGAVHRAPHLGDGRRKVVDLTVSGRDLLARLDEVLREVQERVLEPLDADERDVLIALLSRLTG